MSTRWVDRCSNRTNMISGAESGGVPGVHQVGGQVDRGSNRTFMISGAESAWRGSWCPTSGWTAGKRGSNHTYMITGAESGGIGGTERF